MNVEVDVTFTTVAWIGSGFIEESFYPFLSPALGYLWKALVYLLIGGLSVVVIGALILPALWKPLTEPDDNQDESPLGRGRLSQTEHSASGVIRVIRLTDDGEFVDRSEFTDVLYEIINYKAPVLIVWYIHGWKHNANQDDSDFRQFKELVGELDKQQCQLDERNRRHVIGVYVGWDGMVGPSLPLLPNLTFWNRKRAADRISQSSILTKIIAATKYAREQMGKETISRDLTVMIGHSFGARILFTATSQVLLYEVQRRHPGRGKNSYDEIEGPADLILLLNPAFEASMFTAMHSIRRPKAKKFEIIDPRQQPLLLVLGSDNDWATGKLFPFGQWLAGARRDRQYTALGHHEKYITHSLQHVRSSADSPVKSTFWYDHFEAAGLLLRWTADRQEGNPFLVAQTKSDIIDGHNGIWGQALRSWMVGFLRELQKRAPVP